ncbi:ATP citrate synthase [bacterium]|nr:ATP citrate synthase [bacterium]
MEHTSLFTRKTQCIFWGLHTTAIQRMTDYDFMIGREKPSISGIVAPSRQENFHKVFFGKKEMLIPLFGNVKQAFNSHPECDTFLNFASFRSAFDVTMHAFDIEAIKTIVITAEGIPERLARRIRETAKKKDKLIIGPSTVGAMNPGAFKVANIGGAVENIIEAKLFNTGSVGLVTRSGGLFNELANIIFRNSNGIYEGVAIGGDRFPGSEFLEHMLRFEKNPDIKMIVMLGELGGSSEYAVINAMKEGLITKPVIAWCIGTVAKYMKSEVQFGHAGAKADKEMETAQAKNKALSDAGAIVPVSYNDLPGLIAETSKKCGIKKVVKQASGFVKRSKIVSSRRTATNFICTISDDTGAEPTYIGTPISEVAGDDYSIGDVISMLWFKRRFPHWASEFFVLVLKIVADHGPAVSGAHNTRITARAGKDLISSLVSGLLTIGPRFGGAIDGAAKYFYGALDHMTPLEFVTKMKESGVNIPGIGHRIKSVRNPDKRVTILKEYADKHFPLNRLLPYALEVEKITTAKKDNLILNVDGTVGILLVDLLLSLGYSRKDILEIISSWGLFNGLFLLGRSIGFIGHYIDEKRLNMPMYRHPWSDILYDARPEEDKTQEK